MPTNLIDLLKGYLTPDIVDNAASFVGESSPDTSKALSGIIATIVAALSSLASTRTGAQQISEMLDSGKYDGSMLGSLASVFSGGTSAHSTLGAGKNLLESLFGNNLTGVTDLIARSSGIRPGSTSSLMALAAPLVMHVL